jgi:hypothetical protein
MNLLTASYRRSLGVLVCATLLFAAPARAQSPTHVVRVESTTQGTIGLVTFGPVGPGCDVNAGGAGCAFVDAAVTEKGLASPFGPFTSARTVHLLFGVGGIYNTPSGSHDSAGIATGFCIPEIDTFTYTYADGSTLNFTGQGAFCCATTDCATNSPTTSQIAAIITGGTGKFAGAAGGDLDSAVATPPTASATNFIGRADAYVVLQGK